MYRYNLIFEKQLSISWRLFSGKFMESFCQICLDFRPSVIDNRQEGRLNVVSPGSAVEVGLLYNYTNLTFVKV